MNFNIPSTNNYTPQFTENKLEIGIATNIEGPFHFCKNLPIYASNNFVKHQTNKELV